MEQLIGGQGGAHRLVLNLKLDIVAIVVSVLLEAMLVDLLGDVEYLLSARFDLVHLFIDFGLALLNLLGEHGVGLLAWLELEGQRLHIEL